jgi:DNA-binding NtrC family response regulator
LYVAEQDAALSPVLAAVQEFEIQPAPGIPEAVEHLRRRAFDVVVLCCPLSDWTAVDAFLELRQADADVPIVVWHPQAELPEAVRLTRLGAFDVITEHASEQLATAVHDATVDRRIRPLRGIEPSEPWRLNLVGSSQAFQEVVRLVRLVANRRSTLLITGETGTGKEMAARAIHMAGPRGRLPMVSVCCSALPENLLEAELFGHVRGAFTGAVAQRVGRFEQADGSTLLLDEVGEMPIDLQAKLLRVLQEREFQRLGSSETIKVDVRVIAATNADLRALVRQGRFREDLYYRLNVVTLELPPLRARPGDIAALTQHFIGKICSLEHLPARQISREALSRLTAYPWPGNVRQLENVVERAIILSGERTMLYPSDFPLEGDRPRPLGEHASGHLVHVPDGGLDFEQTVGHIARGIIAQALRKTNGNKKLAADLLGLKRTTLAAKMRSLEAGDADIARLASDFVHSA